MKVRCLHLSSIKHPQMPAQKVLIIRFSSIGDVVLTTPVIRCIKKQWKSEIHYLVKPAFANVLHENPYIDHIHLLRDDLSETISFLREENFDLVIDLQKSIRSIRVSNALGARSISFRKLNVNKWLAVNLKINRLPKNKHLVDRYFDALETEGLTNDGDGLDYFIMPEDEYDAQELVRNLQGYQVINLGATYFTKRIPAQKCQEIIHKYEGHSILLGGKDVHDMAIEIAANYPEKVINFCGKIGLGVSAGIIKHSRQVYTGDTGLMHIAAALQKDVKVLWGNTIPEFGMYPYYGKNNPDRYQNLQVEELLCRPCSKLGFDHCPKGHFRCMMDIEIS